MIEQPIVLPIGGVEPLESLLFVSQIGAKAGNHERRVIPGLPSRLQGFNGLGEGASPSCGAETLLQRSSELGIVWIAGELSVGLPFLDNLGIHMLPPIRVSEAVVRQDEFRVLRLQFLADGNRFVVMPGRNLNTSDDPDDDG